ncbi:hypothetical protein L1887_48895 [Cichorium endivia]|nr:hypothetical protein L1887_48895 [Cichorium endivia]
MIFVWALEQKDEGKRQFEASNPESLKSRPEIHDPLRNKAKERLVSYSGLQASAQPMCWCRGCSPRLGRRRARSPRLLAQPKPRLGKTVRLQVSIRAVLEARVSELSVGEGSTSTGQPAKDADESRPVYNRYYHMFRAGELERLVADAAECMPAVHRKGAQPRTIRVLREAGGWERGNWWGVWRVQWAE